MSKLNSTDRCFENGSLVEFFGMDNHSSKTFLRSNRKKQAE